MCNISNKDSGMIFDIQRWSLHDGPGIRTNVFLKGCPLRCAWCSNPESQIYGPEIVFFPDKCIGCRLCEIDCPYGAVHFEEDHRVDFEQCRRYCGEGSPDAFACTRRCYSGAMKIMGRQMTVEEVMDEALRDRELYRSSGGGITFTGGEPLAQARFLKQLLERTRKEGLQTAVETSAEALREDIERVLEFIDFLFVDLKYLQGDIHRKWMGIDNTRILENCRWLSEACHRRGIQLVVRTPVIPGIHDNERVIGEMAAFIRTQMPETKMYQLLPYHRLGRGKYQNLGKSYAMQELTPPTEECMAALHKIVKSYGLQTKYE